MADEDKDFYLTVLRTIIKHETTFLGSKAALLQARKAPLDMDKDGTITGYYGDGKKAVDILVSQYETVFGTHATDTGIRHALEDLVPEDRRELLPKRIQPKS